MRARSLPALLGLVALLALGFALYWTTTHAPPKTGVAGDTPLATAADARARPIESSALELEREALPVVHEIPEKPPEKALAQPVAAELPATGAIRGLVLDPARLPDPSRPINMYGPASAASWRSTVSDENGRFGFEQLPPGTYSLLTLVKDEETRAADGDPKVLDRLMQQRITASALVEAGATTEITLGGSEAGAIHLSGRVVCAGVPVPQCGVNAWSQSRDPGDLAQSSSNAIARADGTYELELGRAGAYIVYLRPYGAGTDQTCEVEIGPEPRQKRDFELANGRIRGRVVDRAGKSVAKVPLSLRVDPRMRGARPRITSGDTQSDEQGRFAFDHVAPGLYEVGCGGEESSPLEGCGMLGWSTLSGLKIDVGTALDGLTLVLQPACRVEGIVRGLDGEPVEGAHVYAMDAEGKLCSLCNETASDSAGQFAFEALPLTRVAFVATRRNLASPATGLVQLHEGETTKVDLALSGGTVLYVQAVDPQGQPLAAGVRVLDAQQRPHSYCHRGQSRDASLPGACIGPLASGTYTLVVARQDKPDVLQEVKLAGEETKLVRVRCE